MKSFFLYTFSSLILSVFFLNPEFQSINIVRCDDLNVNVLNPKDYQHYITRFNETDTEYYPQYIPNDSAWDFIKANIPWLDCPNKEIEETYYFRWWTYRKHIQKTGEGFVITEFLPPVGWAGKYNTISCANAHHIMEGRWLKNQEYLDGYIDYWYHGGPDSGLAENYFHYSNWLSHAVWEQNLLHGRKDRLVQLLPSMMAAFEKWKISHGTPDQLYWSYDVRDGMEESISGSRTEKNRRATISSYMFGEAMAISEIASLAGETEIAADFRLRAGKIKKALNENLWDPKALFYKVKFENDSLSGVRELHGYSPWYFNIPPVEYTVAWKQLFDTTGFYAPYGPTTAEQRHPGFSVEKSYESHKSCRWDGPSWPFSTSHVLTSMANLLNHYEQTEITKEDYFRILKIYTNTHILKTDEGKTISWIDENQDPYTGEWITRMRCEKEHFKGWGKGGEKGMPERGKAYNHSTYCDLILSGLIGIRPVETGQLIVNPLIPEKIWEWFCIDRVPYHGGELTVIWDKKGDRYNLGKGFKIYFNGKLMHSSRKIHKVTVLLRG